MRDQRRLLIAMFAICLSGTLLLADSGEVSELTQLRAENALLKNQVASLKKQLAQTKKPPTKTKSPPTIEKKVEAPKPNPKLDAFWASYDEWRTRRQQELRFRIKNPRNWTTELLRTFQQELRSALRSRLYISPSFQDEIGVGQIAKVYKVAVFQIGDASNMLVKLPVRDYEVTVVKGGGRTQYVIRSKETKVLVWIKGIDTTKLADGGKARIYRPMAITGTRAYTTSLGEKRTVFVLEPFDSLPPRNAR